MAGKPNPELRVQVEGAILDHLNSKGDDWPSVMARFPQVNKRTFYRWLADIRDGKSVNAVEVKAKAIRKAKHKAATQHMPVPVPPAFYAAEGARAKPKIDFIGALSELYGDAQMQRANAVVTDPETGVERIKNPVFFDASIKRRLDVLMGAVKVMQEIYDLQQMEEFYAEIVNIIIDEIGPAHPDIRDRVITRLQALNDRHMMTAHASAS